MPRSAALPPSADALVDVLTPRRGDGLLVAMSGGVDSCTLAWVAHAVLGDRMLAVTLDAESSAQVEVEAAEAFAEEHGIPHRVVEHSELADPAYVENTPARCYHCRKGMAVKLDELTEELGFTHVAMGAVLDDEGDHRPGMTAAREADIWFPYIEAGMAKADVRGLADELGLEAVAEKPSNACLSSRIEYGREVTQEKLRQVEAAERAVRELTGVDQVRVRHHGSVARIEVPPDHREDVIAHAEAITERVKDLGFTFVSMDLLGYRTGAMNESLSE